MTTRIKKILINDDDIDMLNILERSLSSKNFLVITTQNSEEALLKIESERPHLVITDIKMPGMSGTELISVMHDRNIFIPVIAISGAIRPENDTYLFMEKPFDPQKLTDFVNEYIDEMRDMQLIKNVSKKMNIEEDKLGKVVVFYPEKGWGLLRVVGKEKLIYVNAADVHPKGEFIQLFHGQVVTFVLNDRASRGPRAEDVKIIYDGVKHNFKATATK